MPAADVCTGEPPELSAAWLSLGLIQHCTGLSPSTDVVAKPNYVVLAVQAALLLGQALLPSRQPCVYGMALFEGDVFLTGFSVGLLRLCLSLPAAGNKALIRVLHAQDSCGRAEGKEGGHPK